MSLYLSKISWRIRKKIIKFCESLEDDTKKYIIIFTDGLDNASKISVHDLKILISAAKEKGLYPGRS